MDTLEEAAKMRDHAAAEFPILADTDTAVTRQYGVFDLLDDDVAAPATFVLNSNLQLLSFFIARGIGERVPPEAIVQQLQLLRASGE